MVDFHWTLFSLLVIRVGDQQRLSVSDACKCAANASCLAVNALALL